MKEAISKKLTIVIMLTMLFVLVLNLFLQIESAQENMEHNSQLMIDRIEEILNGNEEDLVRLTDSIKEDYVIRASAVAFMLKNHPDLENSQEKMQRIADLLQVDEICLFDAEGTLYGGTHPE